MPSIPEVIGMGLGIAFIAVAFYYIGEAVVFIVKSCWASFRDRNKPKPSNRVRPYNPIRRYW